LPLVGLRVNNWRLEAIEGFEFTYADVLANQQFMAFCTKHAQALQASGLTRFAGKKPTAKTIGYWLGQLGLSPLAIQKRIDGKRIKMFTLGRSANSVLRKNEQKTHPEDRSTRHSRRCP
jgi:hypothetical protein